MSQHDFYNMVECFGVDWVNLGLLYVMSSLFVSKGPPGTGKTVTSASVVYHLVRQNMG